MWLNKGEKKMAKTRGSGNIYRDSTGKKTRQGQGKFSKYGQPGPFGGNKTYKKKYRGQGR